MRIQYCCRIQRDYGILFSVDEADRNLGGEFQIACSLLNSKGFGIPPSADSLPFQENQLDKSSQMLKYHGDWFIFEFTQINLFANRSIKLFVQLQPPEDHPRWNSDRHSQVADYKLRLPQESRALKCATTIRTRHLGQPEQVPKSQNSDVFLIPWQIHVWHICLYIYHQNQPFM